MKADDQYDYYDEEDDGADHDQPQNKKQQENLSAQPKATNKLPIDAEPDKFISKSAEPIKDKPPAVKLAVREQSIEEASKP